MITRWTACAARCRLRGSADRKRRAGRAEIFSREFLDHCAHGTNYVTGKIGSPLDFISFHAKGSPVFTNDHVRMGMANQLRNMDDAFAVVASFPEYNSTPIVIGESDPEGCAACRESAATAIATARCIPATPPRVFRARWNSPQKYGVNLEGALTWAFEFEDQPPFAGFRELASDGLDLPVLNVFRMFAKMRGQQLAVTEQRRAGRGNHPRPACAAIPMFPRWPVLDKNKFAVLVWHYHDDDLPGPDAAVN